MVNKFYLAPIQQTQQKQIEAKLKSGELIIQDGNIISNEPFLKKQAKIRLQIQQLETQWQKRKDQAQDKRWQKKWARIDKCIAELEKGGKETM